MKHRTYLTRLGLRVTIAVAALAAAAGGALMRGSGAAAPGPAPHLAPALSGPKQAAVHITALSPVMTTPSMASAGSRTTATTTGHTTQSYTAATTQTATVQTTETSRILTHPATPSPAQTHTTPMVPDKPRGPRTTPQRPPCITVAGQGCH